MDIGRIVISEALYKEWKENRDKYPFIKQTGELFSMEFDKDGNLRRLR